MELVKTYFAAVINDAVQKAVQAETRVWFEGAKVFVEIDPHSLDTEFWRAVCEVLQEKAEE